MINKLILLALIYSLSWAAETCTQTYIVASQQLYLYGNDGPLQWSFGAYEAWSNGSDTSGPPTYSTYTYSEYGNDNGVYRSAFWQSYNDGNHLVISPSSGAETLSCTAQWECESVTTDYNYVQCNSGKCVCKPGFDGSATTTNKCRCNSPKQVIWSNGQAFCTDPSGATPVTPSVGGSSQLKRGDSISLANRELDLGDYLVNYCSADPKITVALSTKIDDTSYYQCNSGSNQDNWQGDCWLVQEVKSNSNSFQASLARDSTTFTINGIAVQGVVYGNYYRSDYAQTVSFCGSTCPFVV